MKQTQNPQKPETKTTIIPKKNLEKQVQDLERRLRMLQKKETRKPQKNDNMKQQTELRDKKRKRSEGNTARKIRKTVHNVNPSKVVSKFGAQVCDPFYYDPCGYPVANDTPSGLLQMHVSFELGAYNSESQTNSFTGMVLGATGIISEPDSTVLAGNGLPPYFSHDASYRIGGFTNAGVDTGNCIDLVNWTPITLPIDGTAMQQIASKWRVTAAAFQATNISQTLTENGVHRMFANGPCNTGKFENLTPESLATAFDSSAQFDAKKPIMGIWYPNMETNKYYTQTNTLLQQDNNPYSINGAVGFLYVGEKDIAQTFQIDIIVNFEVIPQETGLRIFSAQRGLNSSVTWDNACNLMKAQVQLVSVKHMSPIGKPNGRYVPRGDVLALDRKQYSVHVLSKGKKVGTVPMVGSIAAAGTTSFSTRWGNKIKDFINGAMDTIGKFSPVIDSVLAGLGLI